MVAIATETQSGHSILEPQTEVEVEVELNRTRIIHPSPSLNFTQQANSRK